MPASDISFTSSGRSSVDLVYPTLVYDTPDSGKATPRISNSTDVEISNRHSLESLPFARTSMDNYSTSELSSFSQDSDNWSISSQAMVRL